VPSKRGFFRTVTSAGQKLVIVDEGHDSGSESRFTLVDPAMGKITNRFGFLVPLTSYAIGDSTFYGVLGDGTLFEAPLTSLSEPRK
jgi:hypothetical protein